MGGGVEREGEGDGGESERERKHSPPVTQQSQKVNKQMTIGNGTDWDTDLAHNKTPKKGHNKNQHPTGNIF